MYIITSKNVEPNLRLSLPSVPNSEAFRRPLTVSYNVEQLRNILTSFDTDGDGRLSKNELRAAFKALGSRWAGFRATCALLCADRNDDGHIQNGEEFDILVKYVMKIGYTVK